jgi:formylglycine-generating enzyme required for sulfatase activity
MGSDADEGEPSDGEAPARPVELSPFDIAATAVSNAAYARFVAATGHVSYAEEVGSSFVFAGELPDAHAPTRALADAPWWREVPGACWFQPEGPGSAVLNRLNHPVVHVCWWDAKAYADWAGQRLPSEAEWEYAARGGLQGARFPWGDELTPQGQHRCNIWQGRFPGHNSAEDGWRGTAPVDAFPANAHGLHNTSGNVWEWCADWFRHQHTPALCVNPQGPSHGQRRVLRGGSYLCHESYCNRYRVSARSANDPHASASHTGFRCAR